MPIPPPAPPVTIPRYTITGEGASPGYFRLVEDPEGAWCTFAERDAERKRLEAALQQAQATIPRLGQEREILKAAIRNQRGDDLCWVTDPEAVKALPQAEFLESCRRYHAQLVSERGEATGLRTIAQLEARIVELESILSAEAAAGHGQVARGADRRAGEEAQGSRADGGPYVRSDDARRVADPLTAAQATIPHLQALVADWWTQAEQARAYPATNDVNQYYGNGLAWAYDQCADQLAAALRSAIPAPRAPQEEETKDDPSRVGPLPACVAPTGSIAEDQLGAVTAAERADEYRSGCTDEEFPVWWDRFGRALDADARMSRESMAMAGFFAGKSRVNRKVGAAMWALIDHLKSLGHPFDSWPDAVKRAFSEAIIDNTPPTESEIQRTHELAERFGWERDSCPGCGGDMNGAEVLCDACRDAANELPKKVGDAN